MWYKLFRMGATNMSILCVQLHEYLLSIIHEKVASLEPQYHSQKSETQPRGLAVPCQGSSIINRCFTRLLLPYLQKII